jgi:16S rRNA (guanine527-N7)-methyltransferase
MTAAKRSRRTARPDRAGAVGRVAVDAIAAAASGLGLTLVPDDRARLERYLALVAEWRTRVNLTGVAAGDVPSVLVAGALCLLPVLPESGRLADLGSGAGVPGLPIAILRPRLHVLLADAARRKTAFLEIAVRDLALPNVDVIQARAEDLGRDPAHRESYDAVTARALAPLRVLAEYALPLLRIGGVAVLPKGSGAEAELRDAARAIAVLGAEAVIHPPRAAGCSPAVVLRKVSPVPPNYPRRAGVPARRPL